MKISCVLTADEIGEEPSDVIVFPEGVCAQEIHRASKAYPSSIIVGTEKNGDYCRGVLMHHHKNQIDYLKIGNDNRTSVGSIGLLDNPLDQNPVYETSNACVGVLICMDVQNGEFLSKVVSRIQSSTRDMKVLCVPADMGAQWFSCDPLPGNWIGIHVALCNHTSYYSHPNRCQSFITDASGKKVQTQNRHEPIHFWKQ